MSDLSRIELEEIVAADLVLWTGWDIEKVLSNGYFAMHWLWGMLNEREASTQMTLAELSDFPHLKAEQREDVWTRLKNRQPRRFKQDYVPPEVWAAINEKFKD